MNLIERFFESTVIKFILFFSLYLFTTSVLAAPQETRLSKVTSSIKAQQPLDVLCLGEESALLFGAYLHGMDTIDPSKQELENRKLLDTIAKELNMRIAIPRSKDSCSPTKEKTCWIQSSREDVTKTYEAIASSVSKCFPQDAKFGLIAFSNGGYLAGKIVNYCITPQPLWAILIGSGGTAREISRPSLKECAPLFILIGKNDLANKSAKNYKSQMERLGADVKLTEFQGGHVVPFDSLVSTLKDIIKKNKAR